MKIQTILIIRYISIYTGAFETFVILFFLCSGCGKYESEPCLKKVRLINLDDLQGALINDEFTFKLRMAIWPLYFITFLIYAAFFGGMLVLALVGYRIYRKRGQVCVK